MPEMKVYELITPSDPITFLADDDKVAIFAAILVGNGKAGLKVDECELTDKTLLLFLPEEEVMKRIRGALGMELKEFIDQNRGKIEDALESFATMDKKTRKLLDETKKHMSKDEFAKFRAEVDNNHRTSMNAFSEFAWQIAKRMREEDEERIQKEGEHATKNA